MSDPTIKAWAREDVYMKRISELEAKNKALTVQAFGIAVERDELRMELGDLPEAQGEMMSAIKALKVQNAQLLEALNGWLAIYGSEEYEDCPEVKATRAAIAAVDREIDLREQNAKTLTNEQIDELWRKSCSLEGFSTAQFVRHFARAAIAAVEGKI